MQYYFRRLPAGNQGSAIRTCLSHASLAREPTSSAVGSSQSGDGDHADLGIDRSDGETFGRRRARLALGDERRSQEGTVGTTVIVSMSEGAIGRAASRGTGPQRIPRESVPGTREQLFERDRRRSVREPRSSTHGPRQESTLSPEDGRHATAARHDRRKWSRSDRAASPGPRGGFLRSNSDPSP